MLSVEHSSLGVKSDGLPERLDQDSIRSMWVADACALHGRRFNLKVVSGEGATVNVDIEELYTYKLHIPYLASYLQEIIGRVNSGSETWERIPNNQVESRGYSTISLLV